MNLLSSRSFSRFASHALFAPPPALAAWCVAGAAICCTASVSPAAQAADTVFYQRAGALFAADADDTAASARRLMTLPVGAEMRWDVSPDGRRIAWLIVRPGAVVAAPSVTKKPVVPATGTGMKTRPATLFIADRTGRRQKKLLDTDTLRDRQGRRVTGLSAASPGSADAEPLPGGFDAWEPVGLCYSADGKTLYISCVSSAPSVATISASPAPSPAPVASDGAVPAVPTKPAPAPSLSPQRSPSPPAPTFTNRATFAVDAATGAAVVDAQGRWKSFAPLTDVDAAGTLLAGLGRQARAATSTEASSPPLVLVNLAEGKVTTLAAPRPPGTPAAPPIWTNPSAPALAPNGAARMAFVSANARKGLWLCDTASGKTFRRLLSGDVSRPRWGANGARIYYLAPRPSATDRPTFDLYVVDAPKTLAPSVPSNDPAPPPATPRLVLQNVEWFDVAAD